MKSLKPISVCLVLFALTGCAVGNKYDYRMANAALPLAGSGDVGVAVVDNRSYVLSGDKEPEFIGLQRGGFGNPFDVTTASGQPLTDDLQAALQTALENSGYSVTPLSIGSADATAISAAVADGGQPRNVVLTVTDWKTDVAMSVRLIYDLVLRVFAEDGEILATSEARGDEKVTGAGMASQNSKTAAAAFETKIGRLFNNPDIIAALQN